MSQGYCYPACSCLVCQQQQRYQQARLYQQQRYQQARLYTSAPGSTSGGSGYTTGAGGGGGGGSWAPPQWQAGSGYSSGGMSYPSGNVRFTPGMAGFGDADFVAGALHGYRWWTMAAPPLARRKTGMRCSWHAARFTSTAACELRPRRDFR